MKERRRNLLAVLIVEPRTIVLKARHRNTCALPVTTVLATHQEPQHSALLEHITQVSARLVHPVRLVQLDTIASLQQQYRLNAQPVTSAEIIPRIMHQ